MKRKISMCIKMIWESSKKIKGKCQERKRRKEEFTREYLKLNLVEMSSRKLVSYLSSHFPKDGQVYLTHMKKIQAVRLLGSTDLSHAIARMDRINHTNDQKRFFFFIGALITIVATAITTAFRLITFAPDKSNIDIIAIISMVYTIPIIIYMMFSWAVLKDSHNKATVIYFKDLLIQAKEEKKNDIEIV